MKNNVKSLEEKIISLEKEEDNTIKDYVGSLIGDDGLTHIEVDLTNGDVYEPYSGGKEINKGVVDYINETVALIPFGKELSIDLITDEHESIKNLIYQEYVFRYAEAKRRKKLSNLKSLVLLIIGIVLLAICSTAIAIGETQGIAWMSIVGEVLSISGSFFIWETITEFFFNRPSITREMARLGRIAMSQMTIKKKI